MSRRAFACSTRPSSTSCWSGCGSRVLLEAAGQAGRRARPRARGRHRRPRATSPSRTRSTKRSASVTGRCLRSPQAGGTERHLGRALAVARRRAGPIRMEQLRCRDCRWAVCRGRAGRPLPIALHRLEAAISEQAARLREAIGAIRKRASRRLSVLFVTDEDAAAQDRSSRRRRAKSIPDLAARLDAGTGPCSCAARSARAAVGARSHRWRCSLSRMNHQALPRREGAPRPTRLR